MLEPERRLVKIENLKERFWQEKKKKKEKFKVKTRKGSLNHKKWDKNEKKMWGQVENSKGRLDYEKDI